MLTRVRRTERKHLNVMLHEEEYWRFKRMIADLHEDQGEFVRRTLLELMESHEAKKKEPRAQLPKA